MGEKEVIKETETTPRRAYCQKLSRKIVIIKIGK
jgi:hypothetical protein